MNDSIYNFYLQHQDRLEQEFEEHVLEGEWGSGEDFINPMHDGFFNEFVEDRYEEEIGA